MHKATGLPLHKGLPPVDQLPWTITWVIRKLIQLDSFAELQSEKRPTDHLIWDGTPEELDKWFDKVFQRKKKSRADEVVLQIDEGDIE